MNYETTQAAVSEVVDVLEEHLTEYLPCFEKQLASDTPLPAEVSFDLFLDLHFLVLHFLDRVTCAELGKHESDVVMELLALAIQLYLKDRYPERRDQIASDFVPTLNARNSFYSCFAFPSDKGSSGLADSFLWQFGKSIAGRYRNGNPAVATLVLGTCAHIWEVTLKLFDLYMALRG